MAFTLSLDSSQSLASPFEGASGVEKQDNNLFVESAGCLSMAIGVHQKETAPSDLGESLGVLEVFLHWAKDIHNICIYHKQDVYAKICLTSDPEIAISTKTINGGGKNPVFNDRVQLNVRTMETSLKCEIWMLSRVKNYLEDQLLGFALVPLSEVIVNNGKLEKEFPLSSTELFDSPAGFVQLSLAYWGVSRDVFVIPASVACAHVQNIERIASVKDQLEKIEFPYSNILNQNHIMISEYFGIKCPSSDSHGYSDIENHISQEVGAKIVERFSNCRVNIVELSKVNSASSSVSTNGFSCANFFDTGDAKRNASGVPSSSTSNQPMVSVNIEPEPKVKQQDFVDMYMKSMQEITKSFEFPTSFGPSNVDQRFKITPKNSGSKVFYGSRAFF